MSSQQKKYDFKVMSRKQCTIRSCKKLIKRNLVERKPEQKDFMCYPHHMKRVMYERNRDKR